MPDCIRVAALALFAAALPASAQTAAVLGRDDAEFARALYNAGYSDLAEAVAGVITGSGKASPKEVTFVASLLLDVRLNQAREETDQLKRKELIEKVLADKEAFIKAHPQSAEAQETRNNLPEVFRLLGETLTTLLKAEKDTAKIVKLRIEGEKIFARAEEGLQERIARLKEEDPETAPEGQLMAALYNLPRTRYFHSLLYPAGESRHDSLVKQAIEGLREFCLEFGDKLLAYEAYVYLGLALKTLGKNQEALVELDDAIKLRETYEKSAEGKFLVPSYGLDIVSGATLQKVLLLTEMKDPGGAVAAAKDYFEKVTEPYAGEQALAVHAAQVDALIAQDDKKTAADLAQALVDRDPQGPWGARGKDQLSILLGKGGPSSADGGALGPDKMLRAAETLATRGEYERSLDACRQVLAGIPGMENEANLGAEAYLLMGAIYGRLEWLHEAAVAYDAAAELYPDGEKTPDAVWRAANCYLQLQSQEKRRIYDRRLSDRLQLLTTRYGTHPSATMAQLIGAQKHEAEQEWLRASELYKAVPATSPARPNALFGAGNCHYMLSRRLDQERKADEAKLHRKNAVTLLDEAVQATEQAAQKTLDREALARLADLGFKARMVLAAIALHEGRAADVFKALDAVDEKGADPDKLAQAWRLRIEALEAQGKLDEAVQLLEKRMVDDPEGRGTAAAAGVLARSLDRRAAEEKAPARADELWKRASRYYLLSVKSQLKGIDLRPADLEEVANRLYVMGLHFNKIAEGQDSFVELAAGARVPAPEHFEQAASLYEAVLSAIPSYKALISQGRCLGFLGRWKDAATSYRRLFTQESSFLDVAKKRFDNRVLAAKPQLLSAYLEWGVAERMSALPEKGAAREDGLRRAAGIFDTICLNTTDQSRLWWQSRYQHIATLIDGGAYDQADIAFNSTARTSQDLGKSFAYQERFQQLKTALDQKLVRKMPAPNPNPGGGRKR